LENTNLNYPYNKRICQILLDEGLILVLKN